MAGITAFLLIALLFGGTGAQTAPGGALQSYDTGLLKLINYAHSLPRDFTPQGTVNLARYVPSTVSNVPLRADAAAAYKAMMAAMEADGVPVPLAVSGYRTYAGQGELFANRVRRFQDQGLSYDEATARAATIVARPGTSEHQTGLAIDISTDGSLTAAFGSTPAGKWLNANSWRFGFILRYPEDTIHITGIIYEPWHFRYVGLPHSRIMFENSWVLEEYIETLQAGVMFLTENVSSFFFMYGVFYLPYYRLSEGIPADFVTFSSSNTGGGIVTIRVPFCDTSLFHGRSCCVPH